MVRLDWDDPIRAPIRLRYKRKGQVLETEFAGPVYVRNPDGIGASEVVRDDLGGTLDLTKVPVIRIGGKSTSQDTQVERFFEENPQFQGAVLVAPGRGQLDLGEGWVLITFQQILSGKRVSGGRPEVQLIDHRWQPDGRRTANRVKILHGRVLELLDREVEVDPGTERIAEELLIPGSGSVRHPLRQKLAQTLAVLYELESRRVRLSVGKNGRRMGELVQSLLVSKLQAAGVARVAQIPPDLTLGPEEVDADLVASAATVGTVEIPGLGRRLAQPKPPASVWGKPYVVLTLDDIASITGWPFANLDIMVEGVDRPDFWQGSSPGSILFEEGPNRWPIARDNILDRVKWVLLASSTKNSALSAAFERAKEKQNVRPAQKSPSPPAPAGRDVAMPSQASDGGMAQQLAALAAKFKKENNR